LEHHSFFEGQPDSSYRLTFEPHLFNRSEHRQLQKADGWISFYILNAKNQTIDAAFHFNLDANVAFSPFRAPYGSVEFSEDVPHKLLFDFLLYVEEKLLKKGVTEIVIKNPPRALNPDQLALLEVFLLNCGFTISNAEVGAVIPVNDLSHKEHLSSWEKKRRLRKSHESGLQFREIEIARLGEVYNFISDCNSAKGYALSMSHEDLSRTVTLFPSEYKLFGVFDGANLAGAAITIRVSKNILSNFYIAHSVKFAHLSPVVMLTEGLYNYCISNGISLLDLGTSALNGNPNFGLLDFKLSVGAEATSKLTFQKLLTR
jgi:hypothetical protein